MNHKKREPGGRQTVPAQEAVPNFPSYVVPNDPQGHAKARDAERLLVTAGWAWPSQLACDADRMGLHDRDFADRLCSVVCGFLRACGEDGRKPDVATAEAVLTRFAVPHKPGELAAILQETKVPEGNEINDLVGDVLRGAEQRSAHDLRELARDTLRAIMHHFNCPRCIACANGQNGHFSSSTRRPILV